MYMSVNKLVQVEEKETEKNVKNETDGNTHAYSCYNHARIHVHVHLFK